MDVAPVYVAQRRHKDLKRLAEEVLPVLRSLDLESAAMPPERPLHLVRGEEDGEL